MVFDISIITYINKIYPEGTPFPSYLFFNFLTTFLFVSSIYSKAICKPRDDFLFCATSTQVMFFRLEPRNHLI